MSVTGRMDHSRTLLEGVSYELAASDFVRFRATGPDDVVAGVVRAVTAEGWSGGDEFRAGLSEEAVRTLRTFAQRRTLLGRRTASLGPLYEALDVVALLPTPEDVPWDSWIKTCLFVARSIGGDSAMIDRRFVDVADEDVAARWHIALEAMNRVEDLAQCRMAEVVTSYGVGFVELLAFSDRPGGLYRAPALAMSPVPFRPTTQLAELAVRLADSLDATRTVVTGPLGQDQLAATLFAMTAAGSYVETAACLSFEAVGHEGAATYLAYAAELPEGSDVAALADAAASTGDQSALYDGRRLVVFSPQPTFEDAEDGVIDFSVADAQALAALADPATR